MTVRTCKSIVPAPLRGLYMGILQIKKKMQMREKSKPSTLRKELNIQLLFNIEKHPRRRVLQMMFCHKASPFNRRGNGKGLSRQNMTKKQVARGFLQPRTLNN